MRSVDRSREPRGRSPVARRASAVGAALFRFVDGSMVAFGVGAPLIGEPPKPVFEPPFPDLAE